MLERLIASARMSCLGACRLLTLGAHPLTIRQVHDERGGVRGFCCLCLENAGVIRGGGSIAGREEMNLLGFYWVDAIEGNEEALQEEREKLRRRKAREERLAAEHIAQMENERLQREAEAHEKLLREREAASRNRREEMRRKVQAVQRKVLTQISARGGSSVHSLGRTFQVRSHRRSCARRPSSQPTVLVHSCVGLGLTLTVMNGHR